MQTGASSADEPTSPPTSFPAHFAASEAAALHLPTRTSKETFLKTSLFTLFPSKTAISQASPFPSPTAPPSQPAKLLAHLVGGEDGQLPLLAAQLLEAHTGGSSWSEDRQGVAGGPSSTSTSTTSTNITSRHSWLRGRPNLLNLPCLHGAKIIAQCSMHLGDRVTNLKMLVISLNFSKKSRPYPLKIQKRLPKINLDTPSFQIKSKR